MNVRQIAGNVVTSGAVASGLASVGHMISGLPIDYTQVIVAIIGAVAMNLAGLFQKQPHVDRANADPRLK